MAVILDCTKAFDLAKYDKLFGRLLTRLPAIIVRILCYCYEEQHAWVRWGRGDVSEVFGISNGTKQGSVASPTFWSIYLNPLLEELRASGIGCHVAGVYIGIVAYADDLMLLAPNRKAAQMMLSICEKFAMENNIKFSTHPEPSKSKSKAMHVVGPRYSGDEPVPLILCGAQLPWVARCEHLGQALTADATMDQDCREKRAAFIDGSVKIREMFSFAHPLEIVTAIDKHCCSFHRSSLWTLDSPAVDSLCASWRRSIKSAWDVDWNCHGYFIPSVLVPNSRPLLASLLSRFHNFFLGLLQSPSKEVQILSHISVRDIHSTLGYNLRLISDKTGLDPWCVTNGLIRDKLTSRETPTARYEDEWRVVYLAKLLAERLECHYSSDTNEETRLGNLISSLIAN